MWVNMTNYYFFQIIIKSKNLNVGVPRSDIYHCVKSSILINDKSSDVQTRIYDHKYEDMHAKKISVSPTVELFIP